MKSLNTAKWKLERMIAERDLEEIEKDMTVNLYLDFRRSPEDMKSLTGYPEFERAMIELTGTNDMSLWTEDAIQEACKISGLSRASVILDTSDQFYEHSIPIFGCSKKQVQALISASNFHKSYQS